MQNGREFTLERIYSEKMKYLGECYKVYYASLSILMTGMIIGGGFLFNIGLSSKNLAILSHVIPIFLVAWFSAFLFTYWDNHSMRLNVEYIERLMARELLENDKYSTWHGGFLGIFDNARVFGIRLVIPLFLIIGALPSAVYYASVKYALNSEYLTGIQYDIYSTFVLTAPVILLSIHVICVVRERKIIRNIYTENNIEYHK